MSRSRRFKLLLRKELKELSKERIVLFGLLIGPIIMFLVFSGIGAAATSVMVHQITQAPKIAVDYIGPGEPGNVTLLFAHYLGADKVYVNQSPEELAGLGYTYIVLVDKGFEENLTRGIPVNVKVVYVVETPSMTSLGKMQSVQDIIKNATLSTFAEIIHSEAPQVNPRFITSPAHAVVYTFYQGRITPASQTAGLIFGLGLAVPLAILITAAAATQVSAISLALEKEAKTLEKMLTLPVTRGELVASKLLAVAILALGGVASYMVGFQLYITLLSRSLSQAPSSGGSGGMPSPKLSMDPVLALVLVVGLILTLYVAITIGFIVGSLTESIRSGQLAANYVTFALALPLFLVFFGVSPLSLGPVARVLILVDPFSALAAAVMAALAGKYALVGLGLGSLVVYSVVLSFVAMRIVGGEYLITGSERLRRLYSRLSSK